MEFFTAFALLIALALLALPVWRQKLANEPAYRQAVTLFITAVIVHYPVAEALFFVPFLPIAVRIIGYILIVLSFRWLCVSTGAPLAVPKSENQ
jgi:hypothetical protein